MGDLQDVSTGDIITAQRQNDINDYIEQATHSINTYSVKVGGFEVIDNSKNINIPSGASYKVDGVALSLKHLADVSDSLSPTDGQVLKYDGTAGEWVAGDVSGGSSDDINVESLTGNKTLTDSDAKYQWLDPNGASRTITLSTSCTKGKVFVIKNTATTSSAYLTISDGTNTLDYIYAGRTETFIFDGTNWKAKRNDNQIAIGKQSIAYNNGIAMGNIADANTYGVAVGIHAKAYNYGVGIGYYSYGNGTGVGIGYSSQGSTYGVAIGVNTNGSSYGVAVGYNADGQTSGVAIGSDTSGGNKSVAIGIGSKTNNKKFSIAIGYYSKCYSYGQTAINIDDDYSNQKRQWVQYRLTVQTTNATQTEMLPAGQSGQKINIRANSHFAFRGIIVARNDNNNEGMSWEVKGMIKRDGSNNTTLVGTPTITEIAKDNSLTWSVAIEADDTNEALVIKVTGESGKTIRWAGVIEGVEVIV